MNSIDKAFYIISLVLIGGLVLLALLQASGVLLLTDLGFPCSFRSVTGYFCPGCGGTHAVCALAAGNLAACAKEHVFVLYTAVGLSAYVLWNTLAILAKKRGGVKIPVMHFHTAYIYIGIAVVLIQWIVKNIVLVIHAA